MVQPSGPRSQRWISSGLVKASQTRVRGASKTRVMTISRSPRAVTFRAPELDILGSVVSEQLLVSVMPEFFMEFFLLSFRAGTLFLVRLHFSQQSVEPLEPALPELAVTLEPCRGVGQWLGFEAARPPLGVAAAGNQTGAFQHFQVLGDCRLRHRKRLGQLSYGSFSRGEPGQDGAAGRIGQGGEGRVQINGSSITI